MVERPRYFSLRPWRISRGGNGSDGTPYDWQQLVGGLFRVRHCEAQPEHAYAAVRYRGRFWYLDDADLDSISTFFLLTWLFNLQANTTPAAGPIADGGGAGVNGSPGMLGPPVAWPRLRE